MCFPKCLMIVVEIPPLLLEFSMTSLILLETPHEEIAGYQIW